MEFDHVSIEEMNSWPELLNMQQASLILSTPERTVNTLANEGAIPAVRIGKRWKFSRRKLMRLAGLDDAA